MKYNIRPGVVSTIICDEHFLVSTGDSRGKIPYIKSLNVTGAWFWSELESGEDREEIISNAMQKYGITEAVARSALDSFIGALLRDGYLVEE